MKKNLTGQHIKTQIERLIESRKPTQEKAHAEFNNGVKFVTDYILEFINIEYKLTKWQKFLRRFKR